MKGTRENPMGREKGMEPACMWFQVEILRTALLASFLLLLLGEDVVVEGGCLRLQRNTFMVCYKDFKARDFANNIDVMFVHFNQPKYNFASKFPFLDTFERISRLKIVAARNDEKSIELWFPILSRESAKLITVLDLSQNKLTDIDSFYFDYYERLLSLILAGNLFCIVPSVLQSKVPKMLVDLSMNHIRYVSEDDFDSYALYNLERLYLAGNPLQDVQLRKGFLTDELDVSDAPNLRCIRQDALPNVKKIKATGSSRLGGLDFHFDAQARNMSILVENSNRGVACSCQLKDLLSSPDKVETFSGYCKDPKTSRVYRLERFAKLGDNVALKRLLAMWKKDGCTKDTTAPDPDCARASSQRPKLPSDPVCPDRD